ncbi:MAG: RHS repeat-associated core domain-containing protein [Anaerolineales bacterium]
MADLELVVYFPPGLQPGEGSGTTLDLGSMAVSIILTSASGQIPLQLDEGSSTPFYLRGEVRLSGKTMATAALSFPLQGRLPPTEVYPDPLLVPLGWGGETTGAWGTSWSGMAGEVWWEAFPGSPGERQTQAYLEFAYLNIADGTPIEVCSRGDLPMKADGPVAEPAHVSPSSVEETPYAMGDWTCIRSVLDLSDPALPIRIGHFPAFEGRSPEQATVASPSPEMPDRYSWQVWIRSLGDARFEAPPVTATGQKRVAAPAAQTTGGIVYLATKGNVARSRDFYTSSSPHWENVKGALPIPFESWGGIIEFALDPFDPENRAWVVLGGSNFTAYGAVWRTDTLDATTPTWTEVLSQAQITAALGVGSAGGGRILASNLQPGLLFVAVGSASGLAVGKSTDYGSTWTWEPAIGGIGGRSPGFELSDQDVGRLWVSVMQTGRILVSNDGGDSFGLLKNFGSFWNPYDIYSPPANNPTDQVMFTVVDNPNNPDLLRSSDGGVTWSVVTYPGIYPGRLDNMVGTFAGDRQQAFYTRGGMCDNWWFQHSADGGVTWANRFFISSSLSAAWMWPNDSNRLLTARGGINLGPNQTLNAMYSSDGGFSWQDKTGDWSSTIGVYEGSPGSCGGAGSVAILDTHGVALEVSEDAVLSFCSAGKGFADNRECAFSRQAGTQGPAGDPINTRTGGFDYPVDDLSIPTSAGDLLFQRSYSSLATNVYTTYLGSGWTHNLITELNFPGDPGGVAGRVLFKAHSANTYEFIDHGNGTYSAWPGLGATLVANPGPPITYNLVDDSQNEYTFDASGALLNWEDPQGHTWTYTYDGNGRLDTVTDGSGLRFIDLSYDPQGRIDRVADHTGRDVEFGYDPAGDLTSYIDVLGQSWTYVYDTSHRLRKVIDPAGREVTHTEYDAQGRAFQQYDANNTLVLEITYNPDGTSVVEDAIGNQTTHSYDARNTLTGQTDPLANPSSREYDFNFRPSQITDENSNVTQLTWSADGANLEAIVDGELNTIGLDYDALNNLTQVTDGRGNATVYDYNEADPDPDRRTLLLSVDGGLPGTADTTTYTYTTVADAPQPPGLLKTITDPNGSVTQFVYDQFGQRIEVIDPLLNPTVYAYDSLGRLKTVEGPLGHVSWTCYDAAGRIVRSVANASGDGGTPQTDPCNAASYQPSVDPAMDRITTYVYDDRGNLIAAIDPAGMVTHTYYDANNRPVTVVQNLYPRDSYLDPNPPAYNPTYPDRNVHTDTAYDDAGNAIATTDNAGIVTRTYYDALGRVRYVVANLVGQDISVVTPPNNCQPTGPGENLCTAYTYDAAANLIAVTDRLGMVTRTWYDANNRPETVVQNLTGAIGDPKPNRGSVPDENLRTDTTYDESGNVIATTDPIGLITRTYYDPANRPLYVVANLVGQAIGVSTPPNGCNATAPDENVCTEYRYDNAGSQIAVIDPNGVITRTYYDPAGRTQFVVANLVGQPIGTDTPPNSCSETATDENVCTEYTYDAVGRQTAVTDPNGIITRIYYDGLDFTQYVVRNLVGQAIGIDTPPNACNETAPDENVCTLSVYDGAGDQIGTIDPNGVITRTYYDELHRTLTVVHNLIGQAIPNPAPPAFNPAFPDQNVRTDTAYGDAGQVTRTTDTLGHATVSCYDGQYRVVKWIQNPTFGTPCSSYTPSSQPDEDLITLTVYDGTGNQLSVTDPNAKLTSFGYDEVYRLDIQTDPLGHPTTFGYDLNGNRVSLTDAELVVTRYEYDALARLTAVVENYLQGMPANEETNVRTEYAYDGLGKRLSILDGNSHSTTFTYDALGRLKTESDALSHTTTYSYDAAGNRASLLDANGFTTVFGYDDLNRLTSINYPAPDADVSFVYDAAGNRLNMTDGVGSTQWVYDDLNRPTAVTDPFAGTVGYGYDGLGNRTSLDYPGALPPISYVYDDASRLQSVTDWDSFLTTYGFDKGGRLSTVTLPNGIVSAYTYNDASQLLMLTHVKASTTYASYGYTYDDVGNRLTAAENVRVPPAPSTRLWVADTGSNRELLFDIATVTNGESAIDLVGEYDAAGAPLYTKNGLNDGPNARGFNSLYDAVIDATNHRLFVSDTTNNRVLVFNLDTSNLLVDRVADAVLGQPNLTSGAVALTASGMNAPRGLALQATTNRLFVADTGYHRVLVFDVAAISNGEAAINVLGQTSFTAGGTGLAQNRLNGPRGLALSGDLLFVADATNNRVLVFNVLAITNGENAVNVLGQSSYTTNTAATSQSGLRSPRGVAVGGSNRLFVADTTNNRIMVFNIATITNGEAAVNVLGQANYTTSTAATTASGLRAPEDVIAEASTRLFVGDTSNHRIMVFDIVSISNGEAAVNVLGQTTFTAGSAATTQGRLSSPSGVFLLSNLLYATDGGNNRLMVFDVASITNGEDAVNLAGQVDGSLSPVYTKSAINDGPNAQGFALSGTGSDLAVDPIGHHLFASDPTNNRVLVFNLGPNNDLLDRLPDAVLGQGGFYNAGAATTQGQFSSPRGLTFDPVGNRLFVADYTNNRVMVFDVAAIANGENAVNVLGQATFTASTAATTQTGLRNPVGLSLDSARGWLFVADYSNHRVMVFDVNTLANGEAAINVLGQSSFTTSTAATTQSGLRNPSGAAFDSGTSRLFVADTNNHRVMVFDAAAITNGENAINVLGQTSFTAGTGATSQSRMRNPQGASIDPITHTLFVADTSNHRVTVYDVTAITNGENATGVLGQANFTSGSAATAQNRMSSPRGVSLVTVPVLATSITYDYDPLYRLTAADYNGGTTYFHYTYDAVGNRQTEVTQAGTTAYVYDIANRLTSVNAVTYTWSNNGNLLSDGASTYTYTHANRLASVVQGANSYTFAYNGIGGRLRQTVNGSPTSYTVDLAAGLTQVLADGTTTYLYGLARIGEEQTGGWQYHLGDALGSVRQLANSGASVTLARSYKPYGDNFTSAGTGATAFQFTGELRDTFGLLYLRARYLDTLSGRFMQKDPFSGSPFKPIQTNKYLYAEGNPIRYTDPAGTDPIEDYLETLRDRTEECFEAGDLRCVWFNYWQLAFGGQWLGLPHASAHLFQFLFKRGNIEYEPLLSAAPDVSTWILKFPSALNETYSLDSEILSLIHADQRAGPPGDFVSTDIHLLSADQFAERDLYYSMHGFGMWEDAVYEIRACFEVTVRPTYRYWDRYHWIVPLQAGGDVLGLAGFKDEWAAALHDAGLAREYTITGYWSGPTRVYTFPANWLQLPVPLPLTSTTVGTR